MLELFLSILPGVLIIIYVFKKDKHEHEPYKYVAICVFFGMLSCVPAVMGTMAIEPLLGVENPGESSNIFVVAFYAFVAVGFSEEFAKFLFLRFYIYRKPEFDEPMDGIVYGVMIGMGFAILENVLYVLQGGLGVAFLRMFTAVPGHAAFGVIMGYYVGLAKFDKNPTALLAQGVLYATLVHGAYDFCLFQKNYAALTLFAFVVLYSSVYMSKKLIKLHVENSPHRDGVKEDNDNQKDNFNHLIE